MFFRKRSTPAAAAPSSQQTNLSADSANADVVRFENDRHALLAGLEGNSQWPLGKDWPIFHEWNHQAGEASGHYFHQDLWAARKINQRAPQKHVDVGSRIDGFVAHVASFREIEIYDIRPLADKIPNVTFVQQDFMKASPIGICDSLSCLHALEHFGLGRYGDPINAYGYVAGFKNISRMLSPGGSFYFSVPIGEQRIEFNAHRIFALRTVLALASENGFSVKSFSFVDDNGAMREDVELTEEDLTNSLNLRYGCGLFDLIKET